MRLAAIYTLYGRRAGAELFVERTLEELGRQVPDWSITVFCNAQARDALRERLPGVKAEYVPWLDRQWKKAVWLEWRAPRVVTRQAFDVFWVPSGSASFPGPWEVPTVGTFLDMGGFLVKNRFRRSRTLYCRYWSTPRTLRRAAALTSISQATADDLVRLFPGARTPRVIHLGPSPRATSARLADPRTVIREETGLSLKHILFSPARTDYRGKGRDILLRAYAEYRRRAPAPLPLVLPGPPGEFHDSVLKDIHDLGLEGSAVWPGRVSDACMEALYAISRALILPSRTEGFGFPVLEAMERGVPVICSDAGSLPEVAGDAALVVPAGNADALLEALLRLEREPGLREELARRGRERCRAFSWEQTGRAYRDVFETVVSGAAGHPPDNTAGPPA
ncbi:MAG TPA: glycosyltransferase family 1 protein [Kiritimatiellia bacterium]|nr:glycosyltransferase family 1 protein [Kiritimatiellia bacterium]HRZ12561.1 glycosyltransferase family 1 protein [Kiritimatiellia bacterium]HSA17639.1 glycosyltransferase family 1 protein [Kiritimatiellia bacterium]